MSGLMLENFTNQQGIYNLMFDNLDDKSLKAFACANKKCNQLVKGYNLPGAIARISEVARDLLKRMAMIQAPQPENRTVYQALDKNVEASLAKALATSPEELLNTLLALPETPAREAFLGKPWHKILDSKHRNYYIKFNKIFASILATVAKSMGDNRHDPNFNPVGALAELVTELSKKQDKKQISSPVIENAVLSLLGRRGEIPLQLEENLRSLIRFELAKLEPEAGLDFDQTLREFEQIISATFEDVRPLYVTYLNIFDKLREEGTVDTINHVLNAPLRIINITFNITFYLLACSLVACGIALYTG